VRYENWKTFDLCFFHRFLRSKDKSVEKTEKKKSKLTKIFELYVKSTSASKKIRETAVFEKLQNGGEIQNGGFCWKCNYSSIDGVLLDFLMKNYRFATIFNISHHFKF
jgi:hypothetical protein